ncbi:unnamed protein product, partial [Closterium sp. NIES-54]
TGWGECNRSGGAVARGSSAQAGVEENQSPAGVRSRIGNLPVLWRRWLQRSRCLLQRRLLHGFCGVPLLRRGCRRAGSSSSALRRDYRSSTRWETKMLLGAIGNSTARFQKALLRMDCSNSAAESCASSGARSDARRARACVATRERTRVNHVTSFAAASAASTHTSTHAAGGACAVARGRVTSAREGSGTAARWGRRPARVAGDAAGIAEIRAVKAVSFYLLGRVMGSCRKQNGRYPGARNACAPFSIFNAHQQHKSVELRCMNTIR